MLKFDTFRKESDKMQLNKNIKRFLVKNFLFSNQGRTILQEGMRNIDRS